MTDGTTPPFRVSYSGAVRRELEKLALNARRRGIGAEFIAALRTIDERLRSDPHTFGEPRFLLQSLQLQVRIAIVPPIAVGFGVHQEQPLVFPKEFRLLS